MDKVILKLKNIFGNFNILRKKILINKIKQLFIN